MPSDASSETPKRSADQIEADIARTREELAATISALADKVNPKIQGPRAAQRAQAAVTSATESAQAVARSATDAAKGFANDVTRGKPKAIAIVAVVVGLAAAAITLSVRRRS